MINTPPKLELQNTGVPHQNEDYAITALITDINEPDINKLCANTLWSVDAPDTLSSASGCSVKVTFGQTGSRQVQISTKDSEGATDSKTLTLDVLPPSENSFPQVKSSGVYSREFPPFVPGSIHLCRDVSVKLGNTIDLRQDGCSTLIATPPLLRYSAAVVVENPSGEALSYDWKSFVKNATGTYNLYGDAASSKPSFTLYSPGNTTLVTNACWVTLKVNAPDPARSKGPNIIWSGMCTYNATRLN